MSEHWKNVWQWIWRVLKMVILAIIIIAVVGWLKFSPVDVAQYQIKRGPIVAEVMGTGTLEARVKVTVSPKISGRIKEVFVDQGDTVIAGSLLVRLEDQELLQETLIAEANLNTAKAAIERLKASRDQSNAQTAQARRHNRITQELFAGSAATQDEAEGAVEALTVAEAALSQSNAAIAEGHNKLISTEKTLEYHRVRLGDTKIVAPFDGLIVRRYRESGDIVVPGSSILSLISTDQLWVSAWVDETEMSKLQIGQATRVVFRSEPNRIYGGKVTRLGREADRETREFIVDIQVLELPTNWAVGQRAEVFIESASKDSAILLPVKFLELREKQPGVFVNVNGYAKWQPVVLGLRNTEMVEVVEGLKVGDMVVTAVRSKATLRDGGRISVR